MFPVTFRDDISRCVRGSVSLYACSKTGTKLAKLSDNGCRNAAAVKKEKFSREREGEENKKGTANPFSTISFLCINWSSYRYACTVIRHCSYSRMNKRQIAQDPLFERHAFSDFERWMYVE